MDEKVNIWFDSEGDYLEINLRREAGYFQETELDGVMRKVNMQGEVIGYSILKVSSLRETPLELSLPRQG